MLGKRGDNLFPVIEDYISKLEESSAARLSSSSPPSGPQPLLTDVGKPLPSIPEGWEPVSSPDHALPNPRPPASTELDHGSTGAPVHAPLSSPVFPTWFATDHGVGPMGPHAPQPANAGPSTVFDSVSGHRLSVEEPPSRPASPTGFDADHGYHVVHPPPSPGSASQTELDVEHEYQMVHPPPPSRGSASPAQSDHEMVDVPQPSSPVSSVDRRGLSVGEFSSH